MGSGKLSLFRRKRGLFKLTPSDLLGQLQLAAWRRVARRSWHSLTARPADYVLGKSVLPPAALCILLGPQAHGEIVDPVATGWTIL